MKLQIFHPSYTYSYAYSYSKIRIAYAYEYEYDFSEPSVSGPDITGYPAGGAADSCLPEQQKASNIKIQMKVLQC
jgi:hypothetical protein